MSFLELSNRLHLGGRGMGNYKQKLKALSYFFSPNSKSRMACMRETFEEKLTRNALFANLSDIFRISKKFES